MDKRGARIFLGCIFCTLLMAILLILALQFSHKTCELVFIDLEVLKEQAKNEWTKIKPLSSHDKSMIFRISAFLEYQLPERRAGEELELRKHRTAPLRTSLERAHQENSANTTAANATLARSPAPAVASGLSSQPEQLPPAFQVKSVEMLVTVESPANGSKAFANNSAQLHNQTTGSSAGQQPLKDTRKRFLPLFANDLELEKSIDQNRTKYVITFNCSTLKMVFVRKLERVYVESMKLELRIANKLRNKCEVKLPNNTAFSTELNAAGVAHYKCKRAQVFACLDKNQEPLVSLHVHGIQWESRPRLPNSLHLIGDFMSDYQSCEPAFPTVGTNLGQQLAGASQVQPLQLPSSALPSGAVSP